jgi:ankyrin repeat protein
MDGGIDPVTAFIAAATSRGSAGAADAIREAHDDLAARSVHAAAILGEAAALRAHLAGNVSAARVRHPVCGWDPLTCLCFSCYLSDAARTGGFLDAARALLDAGADASTGFHDPSHLPSPAFESALYGAAGVAHHAPLVRLLVERGADPNDDEVTYHAPEGYDNRVIEALIASSRLTPDSLATMLLRKHDWHDEDGVRLLLQHGADPNRPTRWGRTPFEQALVRDNAVAIVEALIDHGGNPCVGMHDTPVGIAARRGRADVLDLVARRGMPCPLEPFDALAAACAKGDIATARALRDAASGGDWLAANGGTVLAECAGNGNTAGVLAWLDLGVDVGARHVAGDGYWGVAPDSTALHVAAWRAQHDTVCALIARGADVDAVDGHGRTPLALAVRATVDSYWTARRSPASVEALLLAGASAAGIALPTGYEAIDVLLIRSTASGQPYVPDGHD